MHIRPLLLLAAPVLTAPAVASEGVEVRTALRTTYVNGAGEGAGPATDQETQALPLERWSSALAVDLNDRRGADVVDSHSNLQSILRGDAMGAMLSARAGSHRGDGDAAATAHARYTVGFDVRDQVRFLFTGDARSSDGDAAAAARVVRGDALHLKIETRSGGRDQVRLFGWFQPGSYVLDSHATAVVHGTADDEGASIGYALRLMHAADMTLDGRVQRDDMVVFARLMSVGSRFADFDGDGRLTQADTRGFLGAYAAADMDRQRGLAARAEDDARLAREREAMRTPDRERTGRLDRAVRRAGTDERRGALQGERVRSDGATRPRGQRPGGEVRATRRGR